MKLLYMHVYTSETSWHTRHSTEKQCAHKTKAMQHVPWEDGKAMNDYGKKPVWLGRRTERLPLSMWEVALLVVGFLCIQSTPLGYYF